MITRILIPAPAAYDLHNLRTDAAFHGSLSVNLVDRDSPEFDCGHEVACPHPEPSCEHEAMEGEECGEEHPCTEAHPCPLAHGGLAIAFYFEEGVEATMAECQAIVDAHDPTPPAPVNPAAELHATLDGEGNLADVAWRALCRQSGCTECEL